MDDILLGGFPYHKNHYSTNFERVNPFFLFLSFSPMETVILVKILLKFSEPQRFEPPDQKSPDQYGPVIGQYKLSPCGPSPF